MFAHWCELVLHTNWCTETDYSFVLRQHFIKLDLKFRREFLALVFLILLHLNFAVYHKSVLTGKEWVFLGVLSLLNFPGPSLTVWVFHRKAHFIKWSLCILHTYMWIPQQFYSSFKTQFQGHVRRGWIFGKGILASWGFLKMDPSISVWTSPPGDSDAWSNLKTVKDSKVIEEILPKTNGSQTSVDQNYLEAC